MKGSAPLEDDGEARLLEKRLPIGDVLREPSVDEVIWLSVDAESVEGDRAGVVPCAVELARAAAVALMVADEVMSADGGAWKAAAEEP